MATATSHEYNRFTVQELPTVQSHEGESLGFPTRKNAMKPVVEKQVGPDLMLYDGEADSVHILNPAAQMIYEMHRKGLSVEEVAAALRTAFEVPTSQALEEDIRRAIQDMAGRDLL